MKFLNRRLQNHAERDGGFAMIFTLFLILVITTSSVIVADVVLSQSKPTSLNSKEIHTVDAATAGLQAALGQLRNTQTNGGGDLTKLPCSDTSDGAGVNVFVGSPEQTVALPGDQVTGNVEATSNAANQASYRAVIVYFSTDPTPHESDASWFTANAIKCKAGLVATVPNYAFLQSFGAASGVGGLSASEGDRTQHATYQFSTTTTNTAGGRMAEFNSAAQDSMCLEDLMALNRSTGEAAANDTLVMEPCLALGTPQQNFLYRTDLTIEYGGDTSLNLCIQNTASTPTNAGTIELEPCSTSGSGTTYPYANNTQWEQEFAYDDNGQLQVPNSSGGVGAGICLEGSGTTTSAAATAGAQLVLQTCSGSSTDLTSWQPDPQVGAGKAGGNVSGIPGSPTQQYVNYALFGRCLDVSGQTFSHHLIAYPCKQAPDSTQLTWNQIWHFQVVSGSYGIFYTNCNATQSGKCASGNAASTSSPEKDCLQSPGTLNGAVVGVVCPTGTVPANDLWNATGVQAGNYLDSYLLINKADGMCMADDPGTLEPNSHDPEVVVTTCDGSKVPTGSATSNYLLLKWNAPPSSPAPGLSDIQEDNGSVDNGGNTGNGSGL